MSNIVYFTENKTEGPQIAAEVLDVLQSTEKLLEEAFVCLAGNNGILCGVVNTAGVYSPGIIIWNNEIFYFEGGSFKNFILLQSETTSCTFCSGNVHRIFTLRTAIFANSIPGDATGIAVTADLPEFYHPEYTFFTLDAQVVTNTADITAIEGDITAIEGDITAIQGDITTIQGDISTIQTDITTLQNDTSSVTYIQDLLFEIGDTMYIKNITDFDADGIGVAGTKRENWALACPDNNLWKTALGLGGGIGFNDNIAGRTLVIAGGTKYAVLDLVGADSVTLTGLQSGVKPHSHRIDNGTGATGSGHIGHTKDDFDSWTSGLIEDATAENADEAHENRQTSMALYLMVKYQ